MARTDKLAIHDLTGVAETTLWPLYNRAAEARRPRPRLHDPWAVQIADSIAYDYERNFGPPDYGFVQRALIFDELIHKWLAKHPDGWVAALGEGLDTQFLRVNNGRVNWLSVDLPEVIAVRRRFIPDSPQHCNFPCSALDFRWMDQLPVSGDIFITAAGLLPYLQPGEVKYLVTGIAARFPTAQMAFDRIPTWLRDWTLRGFRRTQHYTLPPMPWGLSEEEVPTLKTWHPNIMEVRDVAYTDKPLLNRLWDRIRTTKNQDHAFSVVHLRFGEG